MRDVATGVGKRLKSGTEHGEPDGQDGDQVERREKDVEHPSDGCHAWQRPIRLAHMDQLMGKSMDPVFRIVERQASEGL